MTPVSRLGRDSSALYALRDSEWMLKHLFAPRSAIPSTPPVETSISRPIATATLRRVASVTRSAPGWRRRHQMATRCAQVQALTSFLVADDGAIPDSRL